MTRLVEPEHIQAISEMEFIFSHPRYFVDGDYTLRIGSSDAKCRISLVSISEAYFVYKAELLDAEVELEELVLIPEYISLVGSFEENTEEANDIDFVVRDTDISPHKLSSIYLLLRKAFGKFGKRLHIIPNPEGPHYHGTPYTPLYDLVLRPKKNLIKVHVQQGARAFHPDIYPPEAKKLDLGTGDSPPNGPNWTFVDIEPKLPGVIKVDLECEPLPFPDNTFDYVRANHILEHIANTDHLMSEIHRVLKPGGKLCFTCPSTSGYNAFGFGHKSYWNLFSFYFYRRLFDIEQIGEVKKGPFAWVYGVLVAKKEPIQEVFVPMKPLMAMFTEFFSADELWEKWAKKHVEEGHHIVAEPKYNGFRVVVEVRNGKVKATTEGNKEVKLPEELKDKLLSYQKDLMLDGDYGLVSESGERLSRINIMRILRQDYKPTGNEVITFFDIMKDGDEDLLNVPFAERRKRLEQIAEKIGLTISEQVPANTKEEINKAYNTFAKLPGIEGIVAKVLEAPYQQGGSNYIAKIKNEVEIKVIVLGRQTNKNNTYSYRCGVLSTGLYANVVEYDGEEYVDLGKTFSTAIEAKEGDILTVRVEEVILGRRGREPVLQWLGPRVIDVDYDRTEPYTDRQVVGLAERGNILQTLEESEVPSKEDEPTRGEIANAFWDSRWIDVLEEVGGETKPFVIQAHWRGLTEEETKLSHDELLRTNHSVHLDMRLRANGRLWGWTIFAGRASELEEKLRKLERHEEAFQCQPKLPQPIGWLNLKDGAISPPGGVGSTSKKWSKFFVLCKGKYHVGYANRSYVELFLEGSGRIELHGKYQIARAQGWIFSKPEAQEPYSENHTLEETKEALTKDGHNVMMWYGKRVELNKGG